MNRALAIGFALSAVLHVGLFAAVRSEPPQAPKMRVSEREIVVQLIVSRAPVSAAKPPPPEPPALAEPRVVEIPPEAVKPVEPLLPKPKPVAEKPKPKRVADERTRKPPVSHPPVKPAPVQISRRPPEPAPVPASLMLPKTVAESSVPSVPEAPAVVMPDPKIRQDYLASLAAEIRHCKYYPRSARRLREEGRVVVSFVIRKDGRLQDIAVRESSGYRRLDEAAIKTLQRVSPFKPIPEALDRDQWAISVPIAFSLRS